jgi:hypothetical protein
MNTHSPTTLWYRAQAEADTDDDADADAAPATFDAVVKWCPGFVFPTATKNKVHVNSITVSHKYRWSLMIHVVSLSLLLLLLVLSSPSVVSPSLLFASFGNT